MESRGHPLFDRGLHEFRQGRFFEAHEEWEELWKKSTGPERVFLQGLIQLAAASVHVGRGGLPPARRLFGLSLEKIQSVPEGLFGVSSERLVKQIRAVIEALDEKRPLDSLETIFTLDDSGEREA